MRSEDGHAEDLADMLEVLGHDPRVLGELIDLFLDNAPPLLAELRAAVEMGDDWRTGRIAHRLRGSVAQFSGGDAGAALARLERTADKGDLRDAPAELERIETAVSALIRAMRTYRG